MPKETEKATVDSGSSIRGWLPRYCSPAAVLAFVRATLRDFCSFVCWLAHSSWHQLRHVFASVTDSPEIQCTGEDSDDHVQEIAATREDALSSRTMISEPTSFPLSDHLVFEPESGVLSFVSHGAVPLERFCSSVLYSVADQIKELKAVGPNLPFCVRNSHLRLKRRDECLLMETYYSLGADLEVWVEIRNMGEQPLQVEQIRVLECALEQGGKVNLTAATRRWSFYQHGWSSWTPVFSRHLGGSMHVVPDDERYLATHFPHGRPKDEGTLTSEWVTVLWSRGGVPRRCGARGLLLGFVSGADQLAEIRLDADQEAFRGLSAISYADGITLRPGERLCSERLRLDAGDDPLALLESYADRTAEMMQARPIQEIPTGWCTWYYFFGENTEGDVYDNLAEIERESLPLKYVLVDDGYQKALGDWLVTDRDKYSDMAKVAAAIHEKGRSAGIWIAPFGLDASSSTFLDHPDWVIRDTSGSPVVGWQHFGQDVYALDLTHPEVEVWLKEVFRVMRHDWGFDLFKIDFLFAACAAGRRYNPDISRAQALRRGLSVIRSAIGEEAFLLGCGAPLLPCVGIVDGMRVGPDVAANWHPFWPDLSMPSTENALRNSITRYFTHGRLWVNDPDCVLVRDRDDQSDLVLQEMRSLVSIVALLGGITISGDNLPSLRKGRFKYLEQMLPPGHVSSRPLDLFENEMPQCLLLPVKKSWGEWSVVAAINWQDRTMATEIDLDALGLSASRYHAYNYWPRRYMGVVEHRLAIDRHLPHETVIILLKAVDDQPDLLTTTFHVAQTLDEVRAVERYREDDGSVTLCISLEKTGGQFGEVWFVYPPDLKLKRALVDGRNRKVSSDETGIGRLGLSLNGTAQVAIQFVPAG